MDHRESINLINQEIELESFKWQIHKGREDLKSKKSELKKSLKQLDDNYNTLCVDFL